MNGPRGAAILALGAALVCLIIGGLVDRRVLEYAIVPDGTIDSPSMRAILMIGQVSVLGLAAWFCLQREKESTVKWSLAVISTVGSLAVGVGAIELVADGDTIVVGWRSFAIEAEKNQLGFRGQSIEYAPEDMVIVLLGDSGVEAAACAYAWMPERRLQYHLNAKGNRVKVFSVGAKGYGQDQQLLALQEYVSRFRADMVIAWLTPGNDINDITWPTHWRRGSRYPKPTFRLQDGMLVWPTETIGQSVLLSRSAVVSKIMRFGLGDRDAGWEHYLPAPYEPLVTYGGPVTRRTYPFGVSSTMNAFSLDHDQSFVNLVLTPPSPRIMYGLNLMRRLLAEMDAIVSQSNGRFLLYTAGPLADLFLDGDETIEVDGRYYQLSRRQGDKNVNYIIQGFQYHHSPIHLREWTVGPEDAHPNEHAVDEIMADLADHLDPLIRR